MTDIEPIKDVALFSSIDPGPMITQIWDATMSTHPKAVIVKTYGSGSIPGVLISKIHEAVRRGVPIFLLQGIGEDLGLETSQKFGITKQSYATNNELLDAGAVALESVNYGNLERINQYILDQNAGRDVGEYQGDPKDNVFKTISDIVNSGGDMFEWISRVREIYNLSDAEINLEVERTHRLEPNPMPDEIRAMLSPENAKSPNTISIPITKEDIIRTRKAVDAMLESLRKEMLGEESREIKPLGKLK